jgi:hypothetical protein
MTVDAPSPVRSLRRALFTPLLASLLLAGCQRTDVESASAAPSAPEPLATGTLEEPLYVASAKIWGQRVIPVCWEDAGFVHPEWRAYIESSVTNTWERATLVDFVGWGQCPPASQFFDGIRIGVRDMGPHTKALGSDLRGVVEGMVLNLTFENWGQSCPEDYSLGFCIYTITVHEFGHALGFAHEQNRPDTPQWCRELEDPQGTNGTVLVGGWDSDSVMNYCNPEYNGYGTLSTGDISGAQRYYGKPSRALTGDFNGDGRSDIFSFSPGTARAWVALASSSGWTTPCFGGEGFNGYDFWDLNDEALVLDYNGDNRDDLLFYRPGGGVAYLMRSNGNGTFTTVHVGGGIAGYDMWDSRDLAVRLDFNADGRDDLLTYRQGSGVIYIARSEGDGNFTNVYASAEGIAGYGMQGYTDQVLILDYDGDYKDDVLVYRAGFGVAALARSRGDGHFDTVIDSTNGIGGYDLADLDDRILAFDYDGDNRDDLFLYRPGSQAAWVLRSEGGGAFAAKHMGTSLGGFDFAELRDRAIALDYNGDNRDDLLMYRPGGGVAYMARSEGNGTFTQAYASHGGLPGMDLLDSTDTLLPVDVNYGNDDVLLYRPSAQAGRVALSNGWGGFSHGSCVNACSSLCSF